MAEITKEDDVSNIHADHRISLLFKKNINRFRRKDRMDMVSRCRQEKMERVEVELYII